MQMIVVYYNPTDQPGKYVARLFIAANGVARATNRCVVADTLEAVRASIPAGMHRIPRHEKDEPQIVETWI